MDNQDALVAAIRSHFATDIAAQEVAAAVRSLMGSDDVADAARALIAKLDECQPHIDDAFLHRNMRCGEYDGPQYGEELSALRASLASNLQKTQNAHGGPDAR
jgi:hypothetical protein